jgi:aspartyl/asparaginyl-tRNA synthetase
MHNNRCDDDAIETEAEMNDITISKHINLFNEIVSNWIRDARKEIAEDTLKSLQENGIDISEDIRTAINTFKEC